MEKLEINKEEKQILKNALKEHKETIQAKAYFHHNDLARMIYARKLYIINMLIEKLCK